MTQTPDTAPRRSGRGVKIALGVSLAINLLILGAVGGAVLNGGPGGPVRDRLDAVRSLGLGPIGMALERGDRDAIVARVGQDRDGMRGDRQALLTATLDFVAAVEADPFDREAAEAALEAQRGHVLGLQERGHGALLDQLGQMSAEARSAFAERLRHSLDRHRH